MSFYSNLSHYTFMPAINFNNYCFNTYNAYNFNNSINPYNFKLPTFFNFTYQPTLNFQNFFAERQTFFAITIDFPFSFVV